MENESRRYAKNTSSPFYGILPKKEVAKHNILISKKINTLTHGDIESQRGPMNYLKIFFLIKKFTTLVKLKVSVKKMNQLKPSHFALIGDKANYGNPYELLSDYKIYEKASKFNKYLVGTINHIFHSLPKLLNVILSKIPVFEPDRPIFLVMDLFLLFYLVLVIGETFLKLGFHLSEANFTDFSWFFFEKMPPYVFFLEGLITLNTSYYSKGIYIESRMKILKHYFKFSFLLDVVTLLPLFMSLYTISEYIDLLFSIRVIKVHGILKRIEEYLQLRGKQEGIFQLVKLIANLLFLAHLSACVWHFLAVWEINAGFETNWLVSKDIQFEKWTIRYVYSLYFAIVTMMTVGYGDISSQNTTECAFNVVIIVYGCAVFAYTINDIGVIFKEMYQEEKIFKKKIKVMSDYMKKRGLNRMLQMKVKKYLEYMFEENKNNFKDNTFIKDSLSSTLRDEMFIELYSKLLKNNKIINSNFSELIISKLALCFHETTFGPDDNIIINSEELDMQLYFILKGEIQLYINDGKNIKNLGVKKKGQSFGELSFITANPKKTFAKCNAVTHVAYIKRSDFISILKQFPNDYEKYCILKDDLLVYQRMNVLQQKCLSCKSPNHFIAQCPLINYIADRIHILKKINHSEPQIRGFCKRKCIKINSKTLLHLVQTKAFEFKANHMDEQTSHAESVDNEAESHDEELRFSLENFEDKTFTNNDFDDKMQKSVKIHENHEKNIEQKSTNLNNEGTPLHYHTDGSAGIRSQNNGILKNLNKDLTPQHHSNADGSAGLRNGTGSAGIRNGGGSAGIRTLSPINSLKSNDTNDNQHQNNVISKFNNKGNNIEKFKNLSIKIDKMETNKTKLQVNDNTSLPFPDKSNDLLNDKSPMIPINNIPVSPTDKKIIESKNKNDIKSMKFDTNNNENTFNIEILNFEYYKNYKYYYPHNNLSHIIKNLNHRLRKKSPKRSISKNHIISSLLFRSHKSPQIHPDLHKKKSNSHPLII